MTALDIFLVRFQELWSRHGGFSFFFGFFWQEKNGVNMLSTYQTKHIYSRLGRISFFRTYRLGCTSTLPPPPVLAKSHAPRAWRQSRMLASHAVLWMARFSRATGPHVFQNLPPKFYVSRALQDSQQVLPWISTTPSSEVTCFLPPRHAHFALLTAKPRLMQKAAIKRVFVETLEFHILEACHYT